MRYLHIVFTAALAFLGVSKVWAADPSLQARVTESASLSGPGESSSSGHECF
jgi:hypothetical protein